jgi:hypothetical protein
MATTAMLMALGNVLAGSMVSPAKVDAASKYYAHIMIYFELKKTFVEVMLHGEN